MESKKLNKFIIRCWLVMLHSYWALFLHRFAVQLTCNASSSSWRTDTRRVNCWFLNVSESISNSPFLRAFSLSFNVSRSSFDFACSSKTPFFSTFTCTRNCNSGNNKFTKLPIVLSQHDSKDTYFWILRGQFLVLRLYITRRQPLHYRFSGVHNCKFRCLAVYLLVVLNMNIHFNPLSVKWRIVIVEWNVMCQNW